MIERGGWKLSGMESEPAKRVRVRRSREEIAELIGSYRQSGQRQREFCQQRGIGLSTLQNYLRRERTKRQQKHRRLLEVEVVANPATRLRSMFLEEMRDCSFESQIYHASGPNLLDVHRKEKPSDSGDKMSILRSRTLGSKSAPQPTTNRNSTRDDSHDLDRDDDRSVVHAIFSLIQMTGALRHAQSYKPEYKPLCQTLSKPKYERRWHC